MLSTYRHIFWLVFRLAFALSMVGQAQAATPDFAIASDVLVYVNDGLGSVDELKGRLQKLSAPQASSLEIDAFYAQLQHELTGLLKGFESGAEMPWTTPAKLSASIIGIVDNQYDQAEKDPDVLLEYMNYQYLSKAYFGVFEYGPERSSSLGSVNELGVLTMVKVPLGNSGSVKVSSTMSALDRFVQSIDYDRAGIVQKDGKPLTPLSFYRAARSLQR